MERLSIADMLKLAETLVAVPHAYEAEVCTLLDRFEAGELTFGALIAELLSLSRRH